MSEHTEPEWELVTLVFVDIRGFTTFADRSTAREAVAFLNEFFEVVIPVITDQGGEVNKLLGDGVLAVFGPREGSPEHADRALAAAKDILAAVDSWFGDRCRVGIGINSGLVLIGMIGGGGHLQVEVVGDPVNVAARVQDATRDLGEPLLLTEATRRLLDAGDSGLVERGSLSLKGKPLPVVVHGLESRNASRTPAT